MSQEDCQRSVFCSLENIPLGGNSEILAVGIQAVFYGLTVTVRSRITGGKSSAPTSVAVR